MKPVYGYIRVSTKKQEEGASLNAQEEAIKRFAEKNNLKIIQWFEEKETAAKQGRPLFNQMIKLLKKRKADGVIMHKIDRSARNLRDWASLGDLIDMGVEVYFAHESLDMNARSGRLSADIQAVIAADYVRNLRQEIKKGIYGRINEGIYPFRAPLGYLDMGKGQLKAIDKKKARLVKEVFEKYATGNYTQIDIAKLATSIGLMNYNDRPLNKDSISNMLNNPFYTGLMKVKNKVYKGKHQPLISQTLYNKVQKVLHDKTHKKIKKHDFIFRKILKCSLCNYSMVGEHQKGNIYYRCHTKGCLTKGLREDYIERRIEELFGYLEFNEKEYQSILQYINVVLKNNTKDLEQLYNTIKVQLGKLNNKLDMLTDAYIEGVVDKFIYEQKKEKTLTQLQELENKLTDIKHQKQESNSKAYKILELFKSLKSIYFLGNIVHKRILLEYLTSNFSVEGKRLLISMKSPFAEVLKLSFLGNCAQSPATSRTCDSKIVVLANTYSTILTIDLDAEFFRFFKKQKDLNRKALQVLIPSFLLADNLPKYDQ